MPDKPSQIICFVDDLEAGYVQSVLKGLRGPFEAAGWAIKAVPAGTLTMDQRMGLLAQEAGRPEAGAAAFIHLQLGKDESELFRAHGLPLGYIGGALDGVNSVLDDGVEGARLALEHLHALGHIRIGCIMGDRANREVRDREAGVRVATQAQPSLAAGVSIQRIKDCTRAEGRSAALILLQAPSRPTALFCPTGDETALGAYDAAAELGLAVPQDLSIIGYDDLPAAASAAPPLTTLHQPLERMGADMAARLLADVAAPSDEPGPAMLMQPQLIQRQSTAAPKA